MSDLSQRARGDMLAFKRGGHTDTPYPTSTWTPFAVCPDCGENRFLVFISRGDREHPGHPSCRDCAGPKAPK